MKTNLYPNAISDSDLEVDLLKIIENIKNGHWEDKVNAFRAETDTEKKRTIKATKVPAFTTSGTFHSKKADSIKAHSGFIAIDFDNIDDLDTARAQLYADKYTYAGFLSISGNGLCIIVKIDPKKHKKTFLSLERYYWTTYHYQLDQSCKNVNRLRFVSFDPDLHLNQESTTYTDTYTPPKPTKDTTKTYAHTTADIDHIIAQIESKRIDLTQDYHTWIALGMALYSELGEAGEPAFQSISQFHPDYNPQATTRKYKSFRSAHKVSISTLFYHAKQHGLSLFTPATKTITNIAKQQKRIRSTPKQVQTLIAETTEYTPDQAQPLIDAVYSTPDNQIDAEDNIVTEIETFLTTNTTLKYNEVTLKYENKGQPVNDRELNSIYLDCKNAVPKASKDLVFSIIDSDRTPRYNPLKDFFTKNAPNHTTTGHIKALADTLTIPTDVDQNYPAYFIRKWMIGAVAMWHKHHSPLMLILVGTKQNTGKTQWFRRLPPQQLQPLYAEAELTGDKDENLLMCSKGWIMNDEMSNKSKRDIATLKKLTSTQWFNLRRPYGRMSEDVRRIAALCGTSNSPELISDPTGNRRLIPIEILAINHEAYNAIDKTALWCEAYHAYQSGEPYQLNQEDIKRLNDNTSQFEEPSLEAELIQKYLQPAKENQFGAVQMSNSDIKVYIETRTNQKLNTRKLGLELKRLGFVKKVVKNNDQAKRVYFALEVTDNSNLSVTPVNDYDAPF